MKAHSENLIGQEARCCTGLPSLKKKGGSCRLFFRVEINFARLFRARLLGPVEFQDRIHADFPYALFLTGLLVRALPAPELAFDGQVRALLQSLRVVSQLAPDDAAVPLGVTVVVAGLFVLVRTLRGEREHGELSVIGGVGGGVLSQKSDER